MGDGVKKKYLRQCEFIIDIFLSSLFIFQVMFAFAIVSRFTVAEFSSNLSETQRKGIIRDLNSGKVDLLISSDAMARGMDIETVRLVVNYDTAANAKTYVHRVGRTARAGKKGDNNIIIFIIKGDEY